jgi:2',3'-cyclic-nucleotide 2'-phosphodiesterase (5'-nucleotidase family)
MKFPQLSVATVFLLQVDVAMGKKDKKKKNKEGFKLQILHGSDHESTFQDPNTLEEKLPKYSAVVNGLRKLGDDLGIDSIFLAAGDHTIPGPFYEAAKSVFGGEGFGDILAFNAMGLDANGMGNHEFDGGISE